MKRLFLIMCMLGLPVLADPVTWTVDGLMSDGGTISGSFIFDDDTDDWSDVFFSYEGGSLADMTFTFALWGHDDKLGVVEAEVADYTGLSELTLRTNKLLTNAGGTLNFEDYGDLTLYFLTCDNFNCGYSSGGTPIIVSGTLIGIATVDVPTSVPEPGTMGLLAAGLAGLGAIRRRKFNRSPV